MVVLFSPDLQGAPHILYQGSDGTDSYILNLSSCLCFNVEADVYDLMFKREETKLVPGPVSLEEGGVIDDGRQQSREGPEQECGEELSHDGIL